MNGLNSQAKRTLSLTPFSPFDLTHIQPVIIPVFSIPSIPSLTKDGTIWVSFKKKLQLTEAQMFKSNIINDS